MSALITHSFLPRSMFNMNLWKYPLETSLGQSTLDLFDPFDELDRMIGRNFNWLCKPDFLEPIIPKFSKKFRVQLDCSGYSPDSIKTEIKDNNLIIIGYEGNKQNESEDYSLRQFKKTYKLPENTENDKLVSFMTSDGRLVIEIPVKEEKTNLTGDLFPKISEDKTNVNMNLALPEDLDPKKLNVTCKDRHLIVKYQDKKEDDNNYSDVCFYKQVLMPENTDFNSLKCLFDKNILSITAPLINDYKNKEQVQIQIVEKK